MGIAHHHHHPHHHPHPHHHHHHHHHHQLRWRLKTGKVLHRTRFHASRQPSRFDLSSLSSSLERSHCLTRSFRSLQPPTRMESLKSKCRFQLPMPITKTAALSDG